MAEKGSSEPVSATWLAYGGVGWNCGGGPFRNGVGAGRHHKLIERRRLPIHRPRTAGAGVCVCFITAGPITKLFAWGEEESGGHVL